MKINIFSFLTFFGAVILLAVSGSEAFGQDVNLARIPGVTAEQSSTNAYDVNGKMVPAGPQNAIDGNLKGTYWDGTIAETKDGNDGWIEVDLQKYYKINKIIIHPRNDCCRQQLFNSTYVIVTDQPIGNTPMVDEVRIFRSATFSKYIKPLFVKEKDETTREIETNGSIGRYVRLQMKEWGGIGLSEIEISGDPTPVDHKPNLAKAWNAIFQLPFDPNFPFFFGVDDQTNSAYYGALQRSPKIVVAKNSSTSFDVAYQDLSGEGKKIRINTYDKNNSGFVKNAAESKEFEGLGNFAGFAKDASKNRFVFTSQPLKNFKDPVTAQVARIPDTGKPEVIWNAEFFDSHEKQEIIKGIPSFMTGFHMGTSRLVAADKSLLITTNIHHAHPYQVILDTTDSLKNKNRAFFQSAWHHNYGQRAFFDGTDFVIMENRDHDVSVTLTKVKPSEVFPLTAKNEDHPGKYVQRVFSVYSHTNFNNNTYTELGNVENGLNDNGYLVLFASERDWDYKMKDYTSANAPWGLRILSPKDIGLVHVKKDFNKPDPQNPDKIMINWLNKEGTWMTGCPPVVDNSNFVNSTGNAKTVNYKTANDGWNWVSYAPGSGCEKIEERKLITKGVKWVTDFGSTYENAKKIAGATEEFTSVNYPKLVRIAQNKYVAVWEEWKAKLGEPRSSYVTTKAALITLKPAATGEVDIEITTAPKDLGKIRLMPGDDAFEFEGKAAWAVGDVTKGKLMFYTVDADLHLASYDLEL